MVVRLAKADAKEAEPVESQLLDLPDQEIEALRTQVADLSTETLLDYFDFMAAGDEEVNRSANPRFPLETVLVRLATLPKTLPVTQLLERLEKLEKRLPRAERPESTSVQAEVTPTDRPVASAAPAASSFAGDKDNLWQSFVSFVGREKKFLASHLAAGSALELPPGELKIGVAERHHLNYLQDPENLTVLKNLATRFFGADVAVRITAAGSESLGRKDETMPSETMSQGDEGSPMVKEALRIFGGSIKTVRRENG